MAFTLDYDIQVSADRKALLLVDMSKYHENLTGVKTFAVKLKTYHEVVGKLIEEYVTVNGTLIGDVQEFGEGAVIEIPATEINGVGGEYLLDNIYDVVLTIFEDGVQVAEVNSTEGVFPWCLWFKDQITLGTRYYSSTMQAIRFALTVNMAYYNLKMANAFGDGNEVKAIMEYLWPLAKAHGLPFN